MAEKRQTIILCSMAIMLIIIFSLGYRCNILNRNNEELNNKYNELQISYNEIRGQSNSYLNQLNCLTIQYNKLTEKCYADIYMIMEYIEPLKETDKELYMIQYNKLIAEYSDVLDTPETIYDIYSAEQINIMLRCIETEVHEQDFESKVNVASVILNRVDHDLFPTDPIEVITSPKQFCYGRTIISEDTILALEYAFEIEDTTNGCLAFRSDACPSTWNGWYYKFTDNAGHHFYSDK